MILSAKIKRLTFNAFFLAFFGVPFLSAFAQDPAPDWDALFERRDGWLGADGIYSLDVNADVASASNVAAPRTLFWFSDTLGGSTRADGAEFDRFQMTNHSFALLDGDAPNPEKIRFFWKRENAETDAAFPDDKPRNLIAPNRWLQDGTVYRQRIWLSALLIGNAWKPERVDAVSIGLNADGSPNFDDVRIDENAPLSFKTKTAQVVFGAALTDDADDGFLYVFGYLDRFDAGSRKDLVVARSNGSGSTTFPLGVISTEPLGRKTFATFASRRPRSSKTFRRSFRFREFRTAAARTPESSYSFTRRELSATKSRFASRRRRSGRSGRSAFFIGRPFRRNLNRASAVTTRKRTRFSAIRRRFSFRITSTGSGV